MKTFLMIGCLVVVCVPPVSADLATPNQLLTSAEVHWRDTVNMGKFKAELAADTESTTPKTYTDDGWPVPVILPRAQMWPVIQQPIFFPSVSQRASWNWQRQQAVNMAYAPQEQPLETVQRVAAFYAPVYVPETRDSHSAPIVQDVQQETRPAASVQIEPERIQVVSPEMLSPDTLQFIERRAAEWQAAKLQKLETQLQHERQQAALDKAFILEEQRQRDVLILWGGFAVVILVLIGQYTAREFLKELAKNMTMF